MAADAEKSSHTYPNYSETKEKTAKMNKDDKKAFVRDAGWVEPKKYDYEKYNGNEVSTRDPSISLGLHDDVNWASSAKRYEWDDDYGEIGPKHAELEQMLFGDPERQRPGDINLIQRLEVKVKSNGVVKPVLRWTDAGIHPAMLDNIKLCHYKNPTPIQAYCLPAIHENLDVIGIAQTGSGKTAAFLIPILSKLMGKTKRLAAWRPCTAANGWDKKRDAVRGEPLVLIVCPTRELAMQIFDETRKLCYRTMLRPCVVYGGGPASMQAEEISKGCDVLIATPGRLQDFMRRPGLLSLARLKYTVLDEADELVDPDWADDLKNVLHGGDNNHDADHRYMMFSATFNVHSRRLARQLLAERHAIIQVGRPGSTHKHLEQICVWVDEDKKAQCLFDILMSQPPARTLIFVNNKRTADELDDYLYNCTLPSTSIHSGRTQLEREDAIRAFRYGSAPIMVATGVSARGLDFHNVPHIINYDLPSTQHGGIAEYVHRIGRTARIGNSGIATSFYNTRNEDIAEDLVKLFMENEQPIPDFLEQFKPPEGEKLKFEDEGEKSQSSTSEEEDNADSDSDSSSDDDDAKSHRSSSKGSASGEVNDLADDFANLKVPAPNTTKLNDADW